MSEPAVRQGALLRWPGGQAFVDARFLRRFVARPELATVVGAPSNVAGAALVDGEVIPVVALSPTRGSLALVQHESDVFGVIGFQEAAAGSFPADDGGVHVEAATVRELPISELRDELRNARWITRALQSPPSTRER
jgi:hypothetical protein